LAEIQTQHHQNTRQERVGYSNRGGQCWDVTPCNLIRRYRRFVGTFCFRLEIIFTLKILTQFFPPKFQRNYCRQNHHKDKSWEWRYSSTYFLLRHRAGGLAIKLSDVREVLGSNLRRDTHILTSILCVFS
jgi:hypothetical protein